MKKPNKMFLLLLIIFVFSVIYLCYFPANVLAEVIGDQSLIDIDLSGTSAEDIKLEKFSVNQSEIDYNFEIFLTSEIDRNFIMFIPPDEALFRSRLYKGKNSIKFTVSKDRIKNIDLLMVNFYLDDTNRAFFPVPLDLVRNSPVSNQKAQIETENRISSSTNANNQTTKPSKIEDTSLILNNQSSIIEEKDDNTAVAGELNYQSAIRFILSVIGIILGLVIFVLGANFILIRKNRILEHYSYVTKKIYKVLEKIKLVLADMSSFFKSFISASQIIIIGQIVYFKIKFLKMMRLVRLYTSTFRNMIVSFSKNLRDKYLKLKEGSSDKRRKLFYHWRSFVSKSFVALSYAYVNVYRIISLLACKFKTPSFIVLSLLFIIFGSILSLNKSELITGFLLQNKLLNETVPTSEVYPSDYEGPSNTDSNEPSESILIETSNVLSDEGLPEAEEDNIQVELEGFEEGRKDYEFFLPGIIVNSEIYTSRTAKGSKSFSDDANKYLSNLIASIDTNSGKILYSIKIDPAIIDVNGIHLNGVDNLGGPLSWMLNGWKFRLELVLYDRNGIYLAHSESQKLQYLLQLDENDINKNSSSVENPLVMETIFNTVILNEVQYITVGFNLDDA